MQVNDANPAIIALAGVNCDGIEPSIYDCTNNDDLVPDCPSSTVLACGHSADEGESLAITSGNL